MPPLLPVGAVLVAALLADRTSVRVVRGRVPTGVAQIGDLGYSLLFLCEEISKRLLPLDRFDFSANPDRWLSVVEPAGQDMGTVREIAHRMRGGTEELTDADIHFALAHVYTTMKLRNCPTAESYRQALDKLVEIADRIDEIDSNTPEAGSLLHSTSEQIRWHLKENPALYISSRTRQKILLRIARNLYGDAASRKLREQGVSMAAATEWRRRFYAEEISVTIESSAIRYAADFLAELEAKNDGRNVEYILIRVEDVDGTSYMAEHFADEILAMAMGAPRPYLEFDGSSIVDVKVPRLEPLPTSYVEIDARSDAEALVPR